VTFLTGVLEEIKLCLSKLVETEFHREHLKILLKNFSTKQQLQFGKLMKLLRIAVSGLKVISLLHAGFKIIIQKKPIISSGPDVVNPVIGMARVCFI